MVKKEEVGQIVSDLVKQELEGHTFDEEKTKSLISEEVKAQTKSLPTHTENSEFAIQKMLRGQVQELDEVERRKGNLIIHRLEENDTIAKDKEKIATVFKDIQEDFQLDHVKSCKRLRVKRQDSTKPRPLLNEFKDGNTAEKLLSNAKKLKGKDHNI